MASLHNYLSDYSVIRLLASGVQLSTWTHPCCNAWHICVWNWGKLRDCWGGLKVHIDTPSESLFQAVWYNWNTIDAIVQLASYKLHVQNQRKSSLLFSRVNNSHHLTICDIVQSQKLIGYLCLYRYIYIKHSLKCHTHGPWFPPDEFWRWMTLKVPAGYMCLGTTSVSMIWIERDGHAETVMVAGTCAYCPNWFLYNSFTGINLGLSTLAAFLSVENIMGLVRSLKGGR